MRFGLLSTLTLAGMLHWMMPEASAAPVCLRQWRRSCRKAQPTSSTTIHVTYPYRYGGHYYSHRAYGHGHWRYHWANSAGSILPLQFLWTTRSPEEG